MPRINIVQGDITTFNPDPCSASVPRRTAIVNAANITLLGGGGVDGAIHRAAGPTLRAECQKLPLLPMGPDSVTRCMTGDAKLTPAGPGGLHVEYVIHTVGPMFPGLRTRQPVFHGETVCQTFPEAYNLLRRAINACYTLAEAMGVTDIALPAISCGVFGCPLPTFAKALHETLLAFAQEGIQMPDTTVYLFDPIEFEVFKDAWTSLGG